MVISGFATLAWKGAYHRMSFVYEMIVYHAFWNLVVSKWVPATSMGSG
jgi:hypothetical protein